MSQCFASRAQCDLTPPSSGRPKACFASFRPPLMSNVRRREHHGFYAPSPRVARSVALGRLSFGSRRTNRSLVKGLRQRCAALPVRWRARQRCASVEQRQCSAARGCPSFGGQRSGVQARGRATPIPKRIVRSAGTCAAAARSTPALSCCFSGGGGTPLLRVRSCMRCASVCGPRWRQCA